MNNFKPRAYSINDLYEWYKKEPSQLILNPKFQRRSVWSSQSRSYLINTILLGLPLPLVFIRNTTDISTKKTNREVVDGQQRLRAIFDFIDNGFVLRLVENEEYGGKLFSELPDDIQSSFLKYELSVNVLEDIDDKDILDIFARLNSYGITLNKQELLNAKYFGYFKQLSYYLGFTFTRFWEKNKIFSNASIMRMKEVELVSNLLVAMLDGIQDLSQIEKYYDLYDEKFIGRKKIEKQFKETIDYISSLFDSDLSNTRYKSSALFYSLFIIIFHQNYTVKGFTSKNKKLTKDDFPKIRTALSEIENILGKKVGLTSNERDFQISCSKSTGDKTQRIIRCNFMASIINKYLGI